MKNPFSFRKLRTRITALIILFVFIISLTLGSLSIAGFYKTTYAQIDDLIETSTNAYSALLENYIQGLSNQVLTLAKSGAITSLSLSHDQKQQNIKNVISGYDYITSIYVMDLNGTLINDMDYQGESHVGINYGKDSFFTGPLKTDGIYLDPPSYDDLTGKTVFSAGYHYNDGNGFDGVICIDYLYDSIQETVNKVNLGETGYSVLLGPDGEFVSHPDARLAHNSVNYITESKSNPELASIGKKLNEAIQNESGISDTFFYDGEELILGYHKLEGTEWTLVSIAKTKEFMSGLYETMTKIIIVVVVCLIGSGVAALAMGNVIASPITKMTNRLKQFSTGDLHSPSPCVKSRDELSILSDSLNSSIDTLNSYVSDITEYMQAVARGDITGVIDYDYVGDFAPIKVSLNDITRSLNATLNGIKNAADQVNSGAAQVAAAAQSLAEGTTHQASGIEELSANFTDISDQMQQTADNMTTALEKTSLAKDALSISTSSMHEMLKSMDEINSAALQIEKIIKVIDDISFQTNILAINASVEAARAGAHGKGFAVVAEEVRNLAAKSAESAKQTATLINHTVNAAAQGEKVARGTFHHIASLEDIIKEITDLVRSIERTANEQASSASNMTSALDTISQVVQSNSATSEQSAAASQELSGQAELLKEMLSNFKLKGC